MAIDPKTDPYILEGRVATMAAAGIIDRGRVYVSGETIVDVRPVGSTRPDGFAGAPVVKVGGTIYPGLIEIHNHLSYNAIPLWEVSKRYAHSGSWQGTDEYRTAITKPAQVLANTAGNAEALVRFVECRCLLGGVTTSQGITLSSRSSIKSAYKGLVRNVESPLVADLPSAGAKIGAPDKDHDKYERKLENKTCYLQHLSEGLGETARKQFTRLQRADGTWALHPSFCGVHSTALEPNDFQVLANEGGSIVWSPISNLLLYGGTTDVAAAKAAGVPIALGSDWAPSGTKNLLGELKVAFLVSQELGGLFTHHELCEMVTSTPAKILGWDHKLGSLEAGKYADLIVIDDAVDEPYQQLVEARETGLTLVVIGGVPRVGQRRLMNRFLLGPGVEDLDVGSSRRLLDLTSTVDPDPTGGISLAEATRRLDDSLARLPELASQLDAALGAGWAPGGDLLLGAGETPSDYGLPDNWQPPAFSVVLDFEDEDVAHDPSFALGAADLAEWVTPMELEGITVPDDPDFFPKLAKGHNLPSYVKTGLPPLYGRPVPSLDILNTGDVFDASLRASRELRDDVLDTTWLTKRARLRIIDEAITVLDRHYVHLPMKRAMHAVDPVQRLRTLRFEIEQREPHELGSDLEFHLEMAGILNWLRDLHTAYRLPHPFRRRVAWLPFLIEEFANKKTGESRFMVSKIVGSVGSKTFEPGVEVLHWNGTPIGRFIDQLAREMPSGKPAARRARALNSLTVRPLAHGSLPVEDWVSLRYRTKNGRQREATHRQPWLVFEPSRGRRVLSPDDDAVVATVLGLDDHADDVQQTKKLMFASKEVEAEEVALARRSEPEPKSKQDEILSRIPTLFRAKRVCRHKGSGPEYGYLRIFSFNIDSDDDFVDEFERLLGELPPEGLILDVRGNGGGLIPAAERILELISPRHIEPERAQFLNTPANLDLCRANDPSTEFPGFSLGSWMGSISESVATGAAYSKGFPLTDPGLCNQRGQSYQGPRVLIVDALCYSATDIFAAGFQDHGIGEILGTDTTTGAGGANVWSHSLLRRLLGSSSSLRAMPGGADLRVAMRRTLRVGPNTGDLVEDLGIRPLHLHSMTERDLMKSNRDLINKAMDLLETQPRRELQLHRKGDVIVARAKHVEWIEFLAAMPDQVGRPTAWRPVGVRKVHRGRAEIALQELPDDGIQVVEAVGRSDDEPVVRTRLRVRRP